MKRSTALSLSALVVAAVVTAVLMARAAGWTWRPNLLVGWALMPYAALAGYVLLRSRSGAGAKASLSVSLIALIFTCWAYIDASFVHLSSTSALIFLFVPLYLLVGGPLLGELLIWLFKRKALHGR